MEKTKNSPSGMLLRGVVLGVGVILFVLLLLADKTNLTNREKTGLKVAEATQGAVEQRVELPEWEDQTYQDLLRKLEAAEGQQRIPVLDSMVSLATKNGRLAHAANYAGERAALDSSLNSQLQAGILAYQATKTPLVMGDSVRFRKFSDRAMSYLEEVVAAQPQNEDALLYLGLSYTESRLQQNAMRGIMTIRKVLDINPDNADASFQLGVFSMRTGQYEKATSRFLKVLELNPQDDEVRFQLALSFAQQGKTTEAISQLDRVIAESTNDELVAAAQEVKSRI